MKTRGFRWVVASLVLPAVTWLSGCGDTTDATLQPGADLQTRDSAGVQMVHTERPVLEPGTEWLIAPEPSLVIGGQDGPPAMMFSRVSDARRFPDGRIVVLDGSTWEIRVFDSAGTHLRTFGGRGEGPTRFQSLPKIEISGPDTVLAWDYRALRRSWFRTDGSLIRDAVVRWDAAAAGFPLIRSAPQWDLAADGTLLFMQLLRTDEGGGVDGQRASESETEMVFHVLPVDLEERLALSDTLPYSRVAGGVGLVFEPSASAILLNRQGGLAATGFWSWRINRYTRDGRLEAVATAAVSRAVVSPGLLERSPPSIDAIRAWLPDSLPAIFYESSVASRGRGATPTLHESEDGHLWVRRGHGTFTLSDPESGMIVRRALGRGEEIYDVLSPDLQWLGSVTTPPNIDRVLAIGDTYILAEWRDDLGVSFLRVHDLIRP